jgi:electron transport protein HydN
MDIVPAWNQGEPVYQDVLTVDAGECQSDMEKEKMIAQKCDLCSGRPSGPACAEVCPASAFVVVKPERLKGVISNRRIAGAMEFSGRS